MAKIYTGAGDGGLTDYPGSQQKLPKNHLVMETMGNLDELNACLGVGLAHAEADPEGALIIRNLQRRLLTATTGLATLLCPEGEGSRAGGGSTPAMDRMVEDLEEEIDRMEAILPPLKSFIIPGGTPLTAHLHQARAVCRRAERSLVGLAAIFPVDPQMLAFINRLSDHLFVLARWTGIRAGRSDEQWSHTP